MRSRSSRHRRFPKPVTPSKTPLRLEHLEDRTLLHGPGLVGDSLAVAVIPPADPTPAPRPTTFQQQYVAQLYRDLLHREAEDFGIAVWSGALSQGAAPEEVVLGITQSREYQSKLVQSLYREWLGREAEPFGLNSFVEVLQSGGTLAQVQEAILGSAEYFDHVGRSVTDFLAALYADLLGPNRVVDPAGAAAFGTALAQGTARADVARAILDSDEAALQTVHGLYEQFLHRPPDEHGVTIFVGALEHGMAAEEVLAKILISKEYLAQLPPLAVSTPTETSLDEGTYRSPGNRHKVQVENPDLVRQIQALGGRLVAEYGSFAVLDVDSQLVETLTQNPEVSVRDTYNVVQLNAGLLDTTGLVAQELHALASDFAGQELFLVQFAGPMTPEWYEELEQTGIQIIVSIPTNAYLVYANHSGLGRLLRMEASGQGVQWVGDFIEDFRLDPTVIPLSSSSGGQLVAVQLVQDAVANPETLQLIDQWRTGAVKNQYPVLNYVDIIVPLPLGGIYQLLDRPDVVSIMPYFEAQRMDERQDQILAGNLDSTGTGPAQGDYLSYLASKGFTQAQFDASNFVVNVSDSGIDNGTLSPNHFALYKGGNRTSTSRLAYSRLVGRPTGPSSTVQGLDGHGTLNAHIVGGFVPSGAPFNAFPHADTSGFRYGLGVAPFVKVGASVIFDPNDTSPNLTTLESNAYRDGARISSNSWGFPGTFGRYDINAQQFDAIVRDARPGVAGNQEDVVVFAGGNFGPGQRTITSPGTAKNVITVGAAENVQLFGPGSDGSGVSDRGANNANDIIDFSGRGPTRDGRKKPDLMAPGTHVTGGVFQIGSPDVNGSGLADQKFDGSGISGGVNNIFFPSAQQWYTASSGTSHATPAVAGAAALVRQYFINHGLAPATPAMTKAALMNTARYLNGVGANDSLWSNNQGMGEVNLNTFFDLLGPTANSIIRDQVSADLFTASGQTRTFQGTVGDPTKPFRVTLAWTDAPGSTVGNAFINNLDLEVTVGGQTYKGNVFSGAFSAPGSTADTRNNVESVYLPVGVTGAFTITVRATLLSGNGVPGNASALDQDFALVVSNGTETRRPNIVSAGQRLTAESISPANNALDPRETVSVGLALRNTGNLDSNVTATLLATAQLTSPSGPQTYALPAGGAAVERPFTFTVNGNPGETLTATLQLRNGTTDLGTVAFQFQIGRVKVVLTDSFDGVTAPALPANWRATLVTGQAGDVPWRTTTTTPDTPPNAAFAPDPNHVTDSVLDSPVIAIATAVARLTFRNHFSLEPGFDGAVLEIAIAGVNGGAFRDILEAGGSFVSGGYNRTISMWYSSPISNRQAWSGNSGGYITTVVNLPAAAAGKTIQLRWRLATDITISGVGQRIDGITITDGFI